MHRDYLRLAVRSSLIKPLPGSCNNGNESSHCGALRRSTHPSPGVVNPVVDKSNPARAGGDKEEVAMACRENSELHLSHVSKGAQKLTQMIDSLLNAPDLDRPSECFAEDLLRSSLDLQESLIMLRKLQQASKVMSERRRKLKVGPREEREKNADGLCPEAMGLSDLHDKLQESRLSIDGSSRNCSKEKKKLIRDSLHRQNCVSSSSGHEKASSSRRSFNIAGSSRVDAQSSEHETVATIERFKKAKSPNLIAKLMGMEEAPSRTSQSSKDEKKKSINLARPNFNMIMPKAVKLPLQEQNTDRKQKSLLEIIETVQFKGIQKSSQDVDETSCFPDTPIVLVKPLNLPCCEREDVERDPSLGKISVEEEIQSVNLVQEKKVSDHEFMVPKTLQRKEVKKREKTQKTREPSLQKNNPSTAEFYRKHKKEGIASCKKTNVIQKPPINGKKQEEKREKKSGRASISQPKLASGTKAKPDRRTSMANSDGSNQRSSSPPVHNLKCSVRPGSQDSSDSVRAKKALGAKPVRRSTHVKAVSDTKKLERGKACDPIYGGCDDSRISTLPNDDLPKLAEQEKKPSSKDDRSEDQKIHKRSISNSFPTLDKVVDKIISELDGKKSQSTEEAVQLLDKTNTFKKPAGKEEDMKLLLLSSKSFLTLAHELFGLHAHQPIHYQSEGLEETIIRNANLLLDCGKEILVHKICQGDISKHPLMPGKTLYTSLDQLVEEISSGIEKLVSYIVVDYDATPGDNRHIRLERDLRYKEMSMNTMWDFGWGNQICVEESDQIAQEVEEHIVSFLVEEIVTKLVKNATGEDDM